MVGRDKKDSNDLVSKSYILYELNISKATLRNWIKSGLLTEVKKGSVLKSSYQSFRNDVIGKLKLTSRANKLYKASKIVKNKNIYDYENSLSIGRKNEQGIYYTPASIIKYIFESLLKYSDITDNKIFCDPCCGTGNFIIEAIDRGLPIDNIYGYDIDENALKIARNRVYEKTGVYTNKIQCKDFLSLDEKVKFDIIATNPPWGQKIKGVVSKEDSSAIFLRKALRHIKDNGTLSMLLPSSLTNVLRFKNIREELLQYSVREIKNYNNPFRRIQEKACNVIVEKKEVNKNSDIMCISDKIFLRKQNDFKKNPNFIFNFYIQKEAQKIINHLYSLPHTTLKDRAKWAVGIVTGNNKKYISNIETENKIPIYRGKHIKDGNILETDEYLTKDFLRFQQIAPIKIYESSKIVYSFISKKLSFAYDNKKRYFLNSANIIIPSKYIKNSFEDIVFLFNTKIMNWIFKSIFNTHKILKSDLECLPIWFEFFKTTKKRDENSLLEYLQVEEYNESYRMRK